MNAEELKQKYEALYKYMANSKDPKNMLAFGKVMTEMFNWYADNKPEVAAEWLDQLSVISWDNYLTEKEAEAIVSNMEPKAPWTREQWKQAMAQHSYELEEEPYYNRCALWVTMSMIYSDSIETLKRFVNGGDMFEMIHALALDKLKDKDGIFSVRNYFNV